MRQMERFDRIADQGVYVGACHIHASRHAPVDRPSGAGDSLRSAPLLNQHPAVLALNDQNLITKGLCKSRLQQADHTFGIVAVGNLRKHAPPVQRNLGSGADSDEMSIAEIVLGMSDSVG